MQVRTSSVLAGLLLSASLCSGQSKPQPLTSVALFKVAPEKTADFMEVMKMFPAALDKLLAAGTILGYGVDADLLHTGEPNLAFWISCADFAAVEAAEKAIQSVIAANPDKMKAAWGLSDFAAHRDIIVRSLESNMGKVPAGVLPVTDFNRQQVKPGRASAARMLFNRVEKPVLDKLVADGTIYGYSLDVEAVHTIQPGVMWTIVLMPNLATKGKVRQAFTDAMQKLPAAERDALEKLADDTFDAGAHRDSLSHALIFKVK